VRFFTRREFQLMLLRRMADFQPGLVTAACAELGATHAQYMAAHNRWQAMLRSARAPLGLELYTAVLGPADGERPEEFGDVRVTAHIWRLPGLWPDLRWEVTAGAGGVALHGWLVRAPGLPVPSLRRLLPWSCVVGDVLGRFPGARQENPEALSRWQLRVRGQRLVFVHGLLQAAGPESKTAPPAQEWGTSAPGRAD